MRSRALQCVVTICEHLPFGVMSATANSGPMRYKNMVVWHLCRMKRVRRAEQRITLRCVHQHSKLLPGQYLYRSLIRSLTYGVGASHWVGGRKVRGWQPLPVNERT